MPYNRENFKRIKKEFEGKYRRNIDNAEERAEEVRRLSPEIREIDRRLSSVGYDIYIAASSENGRSIEEIKAETVAMRKRKNEILLSLGYPENYTDIVYECDICKDEGVIDGHYCECFRHALAAAGYESAGISRLVRSCSFENFSLDYYEGESKRAAENALGLCRLYAEKFKNEDYKNLLIRGGTGLGKTHLTVSMAKEIIDRGNDVIYIPSGNLFSEYEREKFRNDNGADTERFSDCDLLIIDDLGTEMITQFTVSCFYTLINTRLNCGKPTVINTNYSLEDLKEKYGERIFSRILGEYAVITLSGKDVRLAKKMNS